MKSMVDLRWDGNDFRNEQDSSGSTADLISHNGKLQQGYRHGSLTKGVVAYYPMEKGEGEVLHDGALNNLGQINGASWVNGNIGSNSLSFDGSSDYVAASIPSGIGEFTASAWVSSNNWDQSGFEFAIGFAAGGGYSGLGIHNGNVRYSGGGNETGLDKGDVSSFTDGKFHHIAIVHSNERGTRTLYLDGQDIGGDTDTGDTTDGTIKIGSAIGGINWWNGNLSEIRIYERTLAEPEIKALYNLTKPSGTQVTEKQVPGQDQGGISRYKLNGNTKDAWGSNDGTNNGASYITGVYGQAAKFDSSNNDYIVAGEPNNLDFGTDEFSMALWLKVGTSANTERVLSNRDSDNNGYELVPRNDVVSVFLGDGSFDHLDIGNTVITDSNWHHIVVNVSGSDSASRGSMAYVDGRFDGSRTHSVSNISSSKPLNIGRRPKGQSYLPGKIDDVRIYDKSLNPFQVEKLYHKGAYRIPRESTLQ